MKKLITIIVSAALAITAAISSTFSVFAEDLSDVTVDVSSAKSATIKDGNRQQSIKVAFDKFDTTRLTDKSEVIVDFTIESPASNKKATNQYVEFVVQSWEKPDTSKADSSGSVWEIVQASSCTNSQAVFKYDDIVKAYGTKDFNKLSAIYVEAASTAKIKCTGLKFTNCLKNGTHKSDATQSNSSGKSNMLFIVIGIVSGIALAVGILMLILNKKSSKAFDVSSGEFVDKKKAK